MAAPDAVELLIDILTASDLAPLVTHPTTRNGVSITEVSIYGEKLPDRPLLNPGSVQKPATTFLVKSYPGSREELGGLRKPRILLRSYAPSLAAANELSTLADELLHDQTFDVTVDSSIFRVYLEMGAGPNSDEEQGTTFPFCDRAYNLAVI